MAYGIKYFYTWINRELTPCRVDILADGYTDEAIEIQASDNPFQLRYQSGDGNIYNAIKPSDVICQFWSSNTDQTIPSYSIQLSDIYNDAAEFFRIDFYLDSVLFWLGYTQSDNSAEDLQDSAHLISINANDNLGLLSDLAISGITEDQIYEGILLTELFALILNATGLSLSVKAYLNTFENSTDDRSVVDTDDCLQQTALYVNNLLTSDNIYKTGFNVLQDLLAIFGATLFQAEGSWVITQEAQERLFSGTVPGTLYTPAFVVDSAIESATPIVIGKNLAIEPINENQMKTVLRPYKFTKKTFDYIQPNFIISQADLSLPTGATPYSTSTVGDFRYDDYSIATYFPAWKQTHSDTSYLEVVTDIPSDSEVERYIVTPGAANQQRGVQFNNIPVTAGDTFDFSLQFRTPVDTSNNFSFYIRFDLVTPDGFYYTINTLGKWTGPFAVAFWDNGLGIPKSVLGSSDTAEYVTWNLNTDFLVAGEPKPSIPVDGILLIEVRGTNGANPNSRETTVWNDIVIRFVNKINYQTDIVGQTHTQTQPQTTKNSDDSALNYDDSPRNTISGTLLRTPVVDFAANIGEIFFYKTALWHRAAESEAQRLGQLTTYDELYLQRKVRIMVTGDWFGLIGLSMASILQINFIPGYYFIIGVASFNYMTCQWEATLYEFWDDGEDDDDLDNTYEFKYLFDTK